MMLLIHSTKLRKNIIMNTQNKIIALIITLLMTVAAPAMANNDDLHYQQNSSQYINHNQAGKKAVSAVGGGMVKEVDFEYQAHLNRAYFEIEVIHNGKEYDVIVDAKTGKVISKKHDR